MRLKIISGTMIILCAFTYGSVFASQTKVEPPAIETPKSLKSYTNIDKAIENAGNVIDLLATAKFKAIKDKYLTGSCDKPEYHDIFRGYQLAKTAYFLFSSKTERGWFDPDPTNHIRGNAPPALHEPNRIILSRVWTPKAWLRVVDLTSRMKILPAPIKSDLVSFFQKLRSYKKYHSFLSRKPDSYKYLMERVEETCEHEEARHYMALKDGKVRIWTEHGNITLDATKAEIELDDCRKRQLDTIEKETKGYRELINSVRDPSMPPLSHCMDGRDSYYPELLLGKDAAISKKSVLHPNHYMLFFWERRKSEGTTALAEFLIERVITVLK